MDMCSAAPLDILGVDWGLDCLQRKLDWCNGDNRDATYLSALPMVTLNGPGKVLLVAGVNYVAEGLASYMNVAITDPLSQTGLLAYDDEELLKAAGTSQMATSNVLDAVHTHALDTDNLFVVAFSRNCSGVDLPCKAIPAVG
ncbi:hypothetical protein OEZ85_013917 [Tetradesmus obliquus]|uniref:Uncharacterized protein n=1 Tax=Tetradesmus obliquus TaxID=3088 RepID=A0ABY8U6K6_TETOB|nr:hypothetical protein OEZ85_013917 [Tetradesmus obliquus]